MASMIYNFRIEQEAKMKNFFTHIAKRRHHTIISYQELRAARMYPTDCIGISKAMYYRWKRRFDTDHIVGFENESRCPQTVRTPFLSKNIDRLIVK